MRQHPFLCIDCSAPLQVQSPATDDEIEDTLNFQLEELSKLADDELSLIPKMAEWKPWDVPAGWARMRMVCCIMLSSKMT